MVADLARDVEVGACWFDLFVFHACRVTGSNDQANTLLSFSVGWLWNQIMRYFLTSLQIEGFRGINNEGAPLELSFKTDQVNSVFAANAQGKSSVFEALC